jgi:hypothetical protein
MSIVGRNPDNRRKLDANGACELVIKAARDFIDRPLVVKAVGQVFVHLANDDAAKAKLLSSGAIKALFEGLKKHSSHEGAVQFGCDGLKALIRNNDDGKKALLADGACESVTEILKGIIDKGKSAIESCVSIMHSLSVNDDCQKRLVTAKACNLVCDVFLKYKTDKAVVNTCCLCLQNLSYQSSDAMSQMKSKNILPILKEVLGNSSFDNAHKAAQAVVDRFK